MKQYSRVSYGVRCQIDAYLQMKISIPEISNRLGFHKSTIYRELKRNNRWGIYTPGLANDLATIRYRKCRKHYVISPKIAKLIRTKLAQDWSPQQISGRLRDEIGHGPCHQSIYNFIKVHRELKVHLRMNGRKGGGRYVQQRRNENSDKLRIHQRPQIANNRGRIGDWERDTMFTKNGVQLLVCVDRKSRFTKIGRIDVRTNQWINDLTLKLIQETNKHGITMTNDNGGDFKANLNYGLKTYYCEPHKPQQRGTIENTIGLLRQYVCTKTDVTSFKSEHFKQLEDKINLRPRKVLDYRTAYEVYFNKKVALAI